MKTKFIHSLVVVIAAVVFQARIASACDCGTSTVKGSVAKSTAIFTGRVVALDSKTLDAEFEVYRSWKGVTEKTVRLFFGGNDCSYYFKKGEEYLVFASGNRRLATSYCERTNLLSDAKAQKDLAELGKGVGTDEIEFEQPNKYDITEIKIQQFLGNAGPAMPENPIILRLEEYEGFVDPDFYRLARWLENRKFFELKDLYRSENRGSDGGYIEISVVRKGQRKTVTIEMESQELWEIEMVIRGVAGQIAALKERGKKLEN